MRERVNPGGTVHFFLMAPITIPIRGVPVSALGPPYVGAMRSPDTLAVHVTLADGTAVCGRPLVWAKPASVISKRGLCTRCRRVLKRPGPSRSV